MLLEMSKSAFCLLVFCCMLLRKGKNGRMNLLVLCVQSHIELETNWHFLCQFSQSQLYVLITEDFQCIITLQMCCAPCLMQLFTREFLQHSMEQKIIMISLLLHTTLCIGVHINLGLRKRILNSVHTNSGIQQFSLIMFYWS